MKEWVKKTDKYTNFESEDGVTKMFHLYCDICGARHPEKEVTEVFPEEGFFRRMDLCENCIEDYYYPELVEDENNSKAVDILFEIHTEKESKIGVFIVTDKHRFFVLEQNSDDEERNIVKIYDMDDPDFNAAGECYERSI